MDTAIMAVRVALLLLVTGMFAALWSGDNPDQMASIDRPVKILVGKREVPHGRTPRKDLRSLEETRRLASRSWPSSGEIRLDAPLPPGISAGTYLLADQFGRTEIRVVSLTEAFPGGKNQPGVANDHYSVELGNARWHYIRIQQPVDDRTAARRSDVLIR